jgi:hypothetical protein
MNAQVIGTTGFFNVPVHLLANSAGGYQLIYDFPTVTVTCAQAVIVYELVEAPASASLQKPTTSADVVLQSFVTANGLVAGFVDSDKTPGTYAVTLPYSVGSNSYTSDPQVINNPIKR